MSLTQRIIDLATRIAGEVKLKPSKSANEVITGKWDMAQQGVQVVTNLSAPNSGYVGFAAKADGLYQKIGTSADQRLLTATDAALYLPLTGGVLSGTLSATRLISTIATGTAPLSVNSTTIVSNLNADMLDGNHASAFALAAHTHTGVYQPLHANLSGIASLPIMPGLVRTDGAGNWSLDTNPYVVGTPWQGEGYIKDSDFASTGLMTRTGAGTYTITPTNTYSLSGHTHAGVYQPIDADLTAIAGLAGVLGFLVKTNTGTWTLDTSTYALSTHTHAGAYAALAGSPTQAFDAAQINIEAGTYPWQIKKTGTDLTFTQYTGTGATFNTTTGIATVGITLSGETASTLAYFDASKRIRTLPVASYPSLTEIAFVRGVTSAIQTQLNGKALLAGSSTQAFSTASLTLGNSTGNAPVLTLYGSSPSVFSTIKTTNGNLHIDSYSTASIYLNWFAGIGGVIFGNGAQGQAASISAAGLITAPSLRLTTGAGTGKILTSDADGDGIWSDPSSAFSAASETAPGAVEIATTAEVLAMSDMLRSLTPYTLANAFPNLSANNGYISIPIGFGERMIIQYGSFTANTGSSISFPLAFPLYCYSVVITAGDGIALISAKTRFAFTWHDVQDAVTSAVACNWIAIGK